ncbi:hypothetical protein EXIGLDRAFT_708450 [Exidia glandulosa HHB12029]|uniref:Uncharacterized protein n=1 Tax=Exidia glandulosa HHB12029 TaxID=1314781 RepID=A0A165JA19_EXIGL|nr:hypothetical protein EXIGLDRAFT_708450 [Exidia glandulosa HHB12029]
MSGKKFSSRIGILPKLQVGGTNWMTYRNLMEQYLACKNTLQDPNTEETLALQWWKKDIAKYELDDDTYQDLVNEWLKKENTIMSAMNQSLPADIHQHFLEILLQVFEIWAMGEDDEDVLKIIWVTTGKQNEYLTASGTDLCCNTHQEYAKAVEERRKCEEACGMATKATCFAKIQPSTMSPSTLIVPKCENFRLCGHLKERCWVKGGGAEGQGSEATSPAQERTSQHYNSNIDSFLDLRDWAPYKIQMASGVEVATCCGSQNVYYLLTCKTPLVSIGHFWKKGLAFTNDEEGFGVLYDTKDPQRCAILRVAECSGSLHHSHPPRV